MFRIPTVTKNLLIINLIAFIATYVFQLRGIDLADIGGLHFFMASNFQLYQLVTYLFLHASFMHILSNMFGLWMFGCVIDGDRRNSFFITLRVVSEQDYFRKLPNLALST